MKRKIFISHAVKDKDLADSLVDLLQTGMDIKSSDIFCSSLEGLGIPSGSNFIEHIKKQLQSPEIVIALLSPNYFESQFCLCELGATWAMSHNFIPILVPPSSHKDLKGVLTPTQVIDINNPTKLTELQMQMGKLLCLNINQARWELKRNKFLEGLTDILNNLEKPSIIPTNKFMDLKGKYDQSLVALEESDEVNTKLKKQIEKLKKCKDKKEVKKIVDKFTNKTLIEKFDGINKKINSKASNVSNEVFKFILSEYYNHPYQIDWFEHKEEFSKAERYRMISVSDGDEDTVNWENNHMRELRKLLEALNSLIYEDNGEVSGELYDLYTSKYNSDLDPSNQEFWEEHYGI